MEEESFSNYTFSLGFFKRLVIFRLSFTILLIYPLVLNSYVSLMYLCFGIVLLNLEIEKHFKRKINSKNLAKNEFVKLRDILVFKNYKKMVYYLLFLISIGLFIGKLIFLLSYLLWPQSYQDFVSNIEQKNFELYFAEEFNLVNLLLTFCPNLAILIILGAIILAQAYLSNIRIDTLGKFRAINVSYLILISLSLVSAFITSISNISIGSMIYMTIIMLFFVTWSSIKSKQRTIFYPFAKSLQVISGITIVIQYIASINTFRNYLSELQFMNFAFFGIIDFNSFTNNFQDICYVVGVFGVLIFTTYYADVRKLEEIIDIYEEITKKDFENDIYFNKVGNKYDEKQDQNNEENEQVIDLSIPEGDGNNKVLTNISDRKFVRRTKVGRQKTWYGKFAQDFWQNLLPIMRTFKQLSFIVRILQLGSIIVILRYNTVFSLPMMVWLFLTSLTYNLRAIYYATMFLGLPSSILQFYSLYYSTIPSNIFTPSIPSWFGKISIDPQWLEFTLTFTLFILYCNFFKLLKTMIQQDDSNTSSPLKNNDSDFQPKSLGSLIFAIILHNTYYLSLIGLYLIGTNKVSAFNLIFAAFFMVFFASEKFARKFWVLLLMVVIITLSTRSVNNCSSFCEIISRYIWIMGWFSYVSSVTENKLIGTVLSLVGIVDIDIDSQSISGTITDQDFATNLLFWCMFYFVLLQYDVYRSNIMKGQNKSTLELLQNSKFLTKKNDVLRKSIDILRFIYYQSLVWIGYIAIVTILSYEEFSLFRLAQMILFALLLILHIFKLKAHADAAHRKMFKFWNFFIFFSSIIITIKYFYTFTKFKFIEDYMVLVSQESAFINFVIQNAKFIGLSNGSSLRIILIGQIFILVFSVSIRDIFKIHKMFYQIKPKYSTIIQLDEPSDQDSNSSSIITPLLNLQQEYYLKYIQPSFLDFWPNLNRFSKMFSYISTSMLFFYLVILATSYRLCVSIFLMLCSYCYYFYQVNSAAVLLLDKANLNFKVKNCLNNFKKWFVSDDKKHKEFFYKLNSDDKLPIIIKFFNITLGSRYFSWKITFLFSVLTFLLSYCCRMFSFSIFQFQDPLVNQTFSYTNTAAFIIGIYANDAGFLYQNYPYLLLIVFSIIELRLTQLVEKEILDQDLQVDTNRQHISRDSKQSNHTQKNEVIKSFSEIQNLTPKKETELTKMPEYLIKEKYEASEIKELTRNNVSKQSEHEKSDFSDKSKQATCYYQTCLSYIKVHFLECLFAIGERSLLLILLFNSITKQNLFGVYYLMGAFLIWRSRDKDINIMSKITNLATILFLMQYFFLTANLNAFTSPMQIPSELNIPSLLVYLSGTNTITQNQFVKVLGLGYKFSDTTSLISDGLILLMAQLWIWAFIFRTDYLLNTLPKQISSNNRNLDKYGQRFQDKQEIEISQLKSYKFLKIIVKIIILHSSRAVAAVLSFIALLNVSLINLVLVVLLFLSILLIDFGLGESKLKTRNKLTLIIFKASQMMIFVFLCLCGFMRLPFNSLPFFEFNTYCFDKIFIFIALQLYLDLSQTEQFAGAYSKYNKKSFAKAKLRALCTTYQFNDTKLWNYLNKYIQKKKLNEKLESISERIENWNKQFVNEIKFNQPRSIFGEQDLFSNYERKRDENDKEDPEDETQKFEKEEDLIEDEQEKEKENEEEEEEKNKELISSQKKFLDIIQEKVVCKLLKWRDPFLFTKMRELYDYVVDKNKMILIQKVKSFDSSLEAFDEVTSTLDYIENFYSHVEEILRENSQLGLKQNILELFEREIGNQFGSNQYDLDIFGEEEKQVYSNENLMSKPAEYRVQKDYLISHQIKDSANNTEHKNYSIFQTISLIFQVILGHWHHFCYALLIIYQIYGQGYIMILFPLAIFGYALTEETRCAFKFWTSLFGFVVCITILKFINQCFFVSGSLDNSEVGMFLQILLGPKNSFWFEFQLIMMIFVQIILLKESGFEKGSESTIESIIKAYIRVKLNSNINTLDSKMQLDNSKLQNLKGKYATFLDGPNQNNIMEINQAFNDLEFEYMRALKKFPVNSQGSYFFQLFSFSNKKIGKDLYPLIALTQLILALFILLFYSSIENGKINDSITDSFRYNQFPGPMVVMLFLQIGVVLLDRRIILINNKKEKIFEEDKYEFSQRQNTKNNFSMSNAESGEYRSKNKRVEIRNHLKIKTSKKAKQKIGIIDKIMAKMSKTPELVDDVYFSHSVFMKFVLQILLLISLSYFMYFYIPSIQGSSFVFDDIATIMFYIIYSIYFALSALQLRFGIPEFTGRMVLMKEYSIYNSIGFQAYRAIPFFFEIRTLMDWTFTTTALDLFQWLKFEDVYGQLFITKINTDSRFKKDLGEKVDKLSKYIMGFGGIFLLLLLILGPVLLFSTYNPFGSDDFVVGATVSVGLQFTNYYFTIFENSHVSTIQPINNMQYALMAKQPAARDANKNLIQYITMSPFSEKTWSITQPDFELLQSSLSNLIALLSNNSVEQLNASSATNANLQINVQFLQFQAQSQDDAPATTIITYNFYETNSTNRMNATLTKLLNMTNCSNDQLFVPNSYDSLFRLGTQQAPTPASVGQTFYQGIYLQLVCPQSINISEDNSSQIANSYWQITTDQNNTGFVFYTITNKVSSFLVSFSVSFKFSRRFS